MAGWKGTYERLCKQDKTSPLDPATLIELATSAYLIGKDRESLGALTRAHQGFVQNMISARLAGSPRDRVTAISTATWRRRRVDGARACSTKAVSRAERGGIR